MTHMHTLQSTRCSDNSEQLLSELLAESLISPCVLPPALASQVFSGPATQGPGRLLGYLAAAALCAVLVRRAIRRCKPPAPRLHYDARNAQLRSILPRLVSLRRRPGLSDEVGVRTQYVGVYSPATRTSGAQPNRAQTSQGSRQQCIQSESQFILLQGVWSAVG